MKGVMIMLAASPLLLLSQCAPGPSGGESLPTLASPARARAWGSPSRELTDRGYVITYRNPSNSREELKIYGSRTSFFHLFYPPDIRGTSLINGVPTQISKPQTWSKAKILNQDVKCFQRFFPSSDDGAVFHTLGTDLRTPDGSRGFYRIEVEGTKNQMQRWLSELRFDHQ
jgi:hypothetical protein